MGRNCKQRIVDSTPAFKGFRPFGCSGGKRKIIVLALDEYESFRLLDYLNLNQEEAAQQMQISRPTLTRIYDRARKKFALALVEGCILQIESKELPSTSETCPKAHCPHQNSLTLSQAEICPQCPVQAALQTGMASNLPCKFDQNKSIGDTMKIALPSTEEQILCPHFGHAPCFAVVEVEEATQTIISTILLVPEMGGHAAVPPWLKSLGVSTLIAGGLGAPAIENLNSNGIDVLYGAPELPVTDLVSQWLKHELVLNPKPCNHSHDHECEHTH